MANSALEKLRKHIKPGRVYRRRDLTNLSTNLDRHLKQLVAEGSLRKLMGGLYLCPENSAFGEAPAAEDALLRKFLLSDKFLVYSPNTFNSLGLGMTQLYNTRTVLNQKRHGSFLLGGRRYFFHQRLNVPRKLTREVLLVELLNNLKKLAEDPEALLHNVESQISSFDPKSLMMAAKKFGTYSTQKKVKAFVGAQVRA